MGRATACCCINNSKLMLLVLIPVLTASSSTPPPEEKQQPEPAAGARITITTGKGPGEQQLVVVRRRGGDAVLRGGQQQRQGLLPLRGGAAPPVRRPRLPHRPLRPHPRLRLLRRRRQVAARLRAQGLLQALRAHRGGPPRRAQPPVRLTRRPRSLRRAIAPLFNAQTTASLAASFDALTRRLIMRDWSSSSGSGSAVVVLDAALGITFHAICDMLIATLQPDAKRQLQSDVMAVTQAMLAVPIRLPGTRFYAGLQARRRIMEVLRKEIDSRRKQQQNQQLQQHGDFLHSLLLLLTDDQLILDNILTLIIAGQVTTATAITWMVKYLADNRDFQETLRSVQLELAPSADAPLTLQHLNSMELAYMAVKESLRMASIVSWFPRVALEDCQVAGFHIKKGWIVNVDARSLHYDPTIYDNPTVFDPSRFKHGEDTKPYSFLVFGAGGRTCLGMNLAKIMMLIFLHRLVTTFRWEMADDDPSLEKWAMFPRLKNGCPIHVTPI